MTALIGSSRVSEKLIFQPSEEEKAAHDKHNRQAMFNRVKDFWVKGVLESSLHKEARRIELGLEEHRDAVAERPWDMILQTPDRPDCVLPPGTKIADVFEEGSRSLLILGEPGSGKTITLLELAREMINRAEKDPSEKIPVVFNLSSWIDPTQTVADWLVVELGAEYNIPKTIAASWVENDSLFLLLDGLDEVASVRRAECVEAINGFLDEHLVPVVVCCRKEEYEALDSKLKLQSAVLLQSLTPNQIEGYLARPGPDLDSLREALRSNRDLQEFAKTPLILSIMTLAYQGMAVEGLQSIGSTEERRRHLFKTYVDRMFKRTTRIDPELYPKDKTIHWLSWLARQMKENTQTVFLIERMQPSLLEAKAQKRLYSILVVLIFGLIFGLFGGLIGGLRVGLIGGRRWGRLEEGEIKPAEVLNWPWKKGRKMLTCVLSSGLFGGLIFGLSCGLGGGLSGGLSRGLIGGLSCGLGGGLMFGLAFGGLAVIQHFALRFVLSRKGFLPWRLVPFLDYATERIFLRKVGGGYVFVHRMLMDYFADLEPGPEER
ncbi:MAG TPA: NACHT domain-containing protein [Methanotrichaceae archaeon]|nr:NACHT domain-containing protein [Methanotrichaceae archaeon]